jgi:hypothetical protein
MVHEDTLKWIEKDTGTGIYLILYPTNYEEYIYGLSNNLLDISNKTLVKSRTIFLDINIDVCLN